MSANKHNQTNHDTIFRRLLRVGESLFELVERTINKGFGEKNNWLYYLGAIPVLLLLVLLFSGLYLFIYYDLSLNNAYDSIQNITKASLLGNLMRSIHRYAADAMILFVILHFLRMFFKKYYQNHRWLAWVSGIIVLAFLLIQGVTGYILPLDSTANFVMQESAILLGSVKIFGNTLSRSFASPGNSGKWIMWIIMIIHLAIPMLVLFGIFVHVKRVSRARIFPPKSIIWATIIGLIVFALLFPVTMLDRADPYKLAYLQETDWFYLFLTPFMQQDKSLYIWAGFFGVVFLLILVPWLSRSAKINYAQLELSACTGCTLCAKDCPYEAIAMQPRSDGADYKFEARISADLCSGCGICIGACAYGALNLLQQDIQDPHQQIRDLLYSENKQNNNTPAYLGLVCKKQAKRLPSASLEIGTETVRIMELECVGKFGMSMLETAQDAGAAGIVAYSCPEGNCSFREGNKWFEQRMNATRKPKFNRVKNAPVIGMIHLNGDESIVEQTGSMIQEMKTSAKSAILRRLLGKKPAFVILSILSVVVLFSALYIGTIGTRMSIPLDTSKAIVRLDFFYRTDRKACNPEALNPAEYRKAVERVTSRVKMENLTQEARDRLIASARATALSKFCGRERRSLKLRLYLDDTLQLEKIFYPSGLQNDGLVYALHEESIKPGNYRLKIEISDEGKPVSHSFVINRKFEGAQKFFIDFDKNQNRFTGR